MARRSDSRPTAARRQLITAAAASAATGITLPGWLALGSGEARAQQAFPSKPIRLVVGYPPGGSGDFVSRVIADGISRELGVSVVVENRPGAGGAIASDFVAKSAPDGYTLLNAGPPAVLKALYKKLAYNPDTDCQLCAGPAYHAAPLAFDISAALGAGVPLIFIDKWDSELVLRTISEKRVTHFHMVPIMFQRLLALPAEVKARHPVDHVTYIVHGAAPCPPEVKHAMIEWFGPKLSEYYAGSEGGAGFTIDSHEWLKKPGSVGKRPQLLQVRILDENGQDLPNGQAGGIYHQLPPGGGFTYYKDEAKTNASRVDGFFTMGDVGYFDEDDYLFLTGRNAETIISGGVNIYPQEVDNELIKHDAVADSATVGIPHDEWGEQVKAVILLKPGYEPSDQLAQEILDFGRRSLPSFKVPRSLDFVTELPRSEAGKIQRNKVRAPYWEGRTRQI